MSAPVETASAPKRKVLSALWRWTTLFGGVAVFTVVASELHVTQGVAFDRPVMGWLHSMRSTALTESMLAVTALGDGPVITLVATAGAAYFWVNRHHHSALYLAAASTGAGLINAGLKMIFARMRPELAFYDAGGFAFPSGHSMSSAATYGAIAIITSTRYPRLRWPVTAGCAALVGLVGCSRAYLHVHFPSDVVAGWALGLTWPLWLKPLAIGRGFTPGHVARDELTSDGFSPEALAREEHRHAVGRASREAS